MLPRYQYVRSFQAVAIISQLQTVLRVCDQLSEADVATAKGKLGITTVDSLVVGAE
jgi:hypothetical protein